MNEGPMQELKKEIGKLRENLSALVHLVAELRKAELNLKQEIGSLKSENDNLTGKVRFLEENNKMANLASAIDPDKREEMKLKIRDLVREIDGCIAIVKG